MLVPRWPHEVAFGRRGKCRRRQNAAEISDRDPFAGRNPVKQSARRDLNRLVHCKQLAKESLRHTRGLGGLLEALRSCNS